MASAFTPIWRLPASADEAIGRSELPPRDPTAEFLLAARRQFVAVALCAMLGLTAGLAHYLTSPKAYTATATVLVDERQSGLSQQFSADEAPARDETALLNQLEILGSLQLARAVAGELSPEERAAFLDMPPSGARRLVSSIIGRVRALLPEPVTQAAQPSAEALAEKAELDLAAQLRDRVRIERAGRSFAIDIGLVAHSPDIAARVVNAYADAYLADQLNANVDASRRTSSWMQERLDELQQAAAAAMAEAQDFRNQRGAADQQGLRQREERAEALNEIARTLLTRYQQIAMEASYPVTNGRILSRAMVPERPDLPKAWQLLAAGLLLGLVLGLGVAAWREFGERGFRTGGDVLGETGLSFLGYLPRIGARQLRGPPPEPAAPPVPQPPTGFVSIRRREPAAPAPLPLAIAARTEPLPGAAVAPMFLLPVLAPGSGYVAALRNILAAVENDGSTRSAAGDVVGIGGLFPGEGATTLAANLANLAAMTGRRVLLVDADFDRQDLARGLGLDSEGSEPASVPDAAPCRLPWTGCDVIASPAGGIHGLKVRIEELKPGYDLVVVDLPAIASGAVVRALAPALDHVILVAHWGRTRRDFLRSALRNEPGLRARVLGIALSRVRMRSLPRYSVPLGPGGLVAPF